MSKVGLIISREYLTRVKKKSFIILTFLVPLIFAALMVLPVYLAIKTEKNTRVLVVDDNEYFINRFKENDHLTFSYRSGDIAQIKNEALDGEFDAVLYLPKNSQKMVANLYYKEEPSMGLCSDLESQIDNIFFDQMLRDSFNIDAEKFNTIKNASRAEITTLQIDDQGDEKESLAEMNKSIGMICGFFIYFFIFMFAGQVLRGVWEEKNNRIVEVLISSVKPIELLMGKIIGLALVGLTQFLMWVAFTFIILCGIQMAVPNLLNDSDTSSQMVAEMMNESQMAAEDTFDASTIFSDISNYFPISFSQLILCFLFFFLTGYLIYAALFAAVGSAADNETDSNQLTLPITMPLILTIVLIMPIANNPNGQLAFWLSMIPFTSPVAMLTRLPSGVPLWELLLSMTLMLVFFVLTVWFAAKVYRTGILMYGKKVTWKEIWKWLKY
ncbi:MAG: ABC transporter permease [Bacteroidales bacterium]|nr:ABC transporter permease [Bacteroidales bacterium]